MSILKKYFEQFRKSDKQRELERRRKAHQLYLAMRHRRGQRKIVNVIAKVDGIQFISNPR